MEGDRGYQMRISGELINAVRSKFPHLAKLKPRAIAEIALGKLLLERSSPSQAQTVIQVPVPPPAEKVRVPQESPTEQKALDRLAAKELERELTRLKDSE
jgi:ribosome-associated translation inhibitor RaiA